MAKKTFSFGPPARERARAGQQAITAVDREILRKTVDDGVRALENARIVPLARITPDPEQPRRSMDQQALAELAASIRAEGILQPLWVRYRYEEDDYMIVSGERRYRAALLAGLTEVPVLIGSVNGATRLVHQLIENLQREDLNPLDKGQALERLKTLLPGTWQEIADLVGLTRRRVEQLRALPRLPQPLQDAVRDGSLTEDHARAIAPLPEASHAPLRDAVAAHHLSTRQARNLIRLLQTDAAVSSGDHAAIAAAIASILGTVTHSAVRPRSRAAIPVYEKALDFEHVLDRLPALEYQEDRLLLTAILARIAAKIAAIGTL